MAGLASRRRGAHADYTWPGYVDALASLLMVLVFLLAFYTVAQFALGTAVSERDRSIAGLKGDVSLRDTTIDKLGAQLSQLGDLLRMQRARAEELDKRVGALTTDLRGATTARDKLAADLRGAEERIAGFTVERTALEARLAEIAAARAEQERRLGALTREGEARAAEAAAERTRRMSQEAALTTERDRLAAQLLALTGDREKLEALLRAAEREAASRSADAANAADALRREIDRQKLELTRLAASLASANNERGKLWDDLTEEQKLTAESKAAVTRLAGELNATRAELAKLNAALDAADARAKEQQAQIVELGQRLNRALASKVEELSRYRSEFFGRLSEALRGQAGIAVVGDRFVFQSEVLFDSGSADLNPAGLRQLEQLATQLAGLMRVIPGDVDWVLQVNGHTDSAPISNERFPSNWELSSARAIAVLKFLVDKGVPPQRLLAAGHANFLPLATGDTPAARARNRRIELRLTNR
ncbi:MAG: OmpA family protein [Rhodospirillales bacterium]|nr:MAG: OmpA family protein [Rhodospirillales bacterium]